MGRKKKSYGPPKVVVSRSLVHVGGPFGDGKIRDVPLGGVKPIKRGFKRIPHGGPTYLRTKTPAPGQIGTSYKRVAGWKSTRLVQANALSTTAVWAGATAIGYQRGYKKAATATSTGRAKYAAMQRKSYNRGVKSGQRVGGKIGGA